MARSEGETLKVLWSCAAYADRTSLYNSSLGHHMKAKNWARYDPAQDGRKGECTDRVGVVGASKSLCEE